MDAAAVSQGDAVRAIEEGYEQESGRERDDTAS